jgi:hypothetical protein
LYQLIEYCGSVLNARYIDPGYLFLFSKPGELALGIIAGALFYQFNSVM